MTQTNDQSSEPISDFERTKSLQRTLLRMAERFDAFHMRLQTLRIKNGLQSDTRGPTFPTVKDYTEETIMKEILYFHGCILTIIAEIRSLESGEKLESWAVTAEDLLKDTPQLEWI